MHHTGHKTGLMTCYTRRTSRDIRVSHQLGGWMGADLQFKKQIKQKSYVCWP